MTILIFFVSLWYMSLFTQTFFQHRYAAHAAFKMSKFWERFFFIFTYLMQGYSYSCPRSYPVILLLKWLGIIRVNRTLVVSVPKGISHRDETVNN